MPDCLSPVVVHDQCFMKRMHVKVMELHDRVVIADCFSSDAAAPVALGVSVQCVFVTFLYTLPTARFAVPLCSNMHRIRKRGLYVPRSDGAA
jgi:hypothetical protein